MSMSILDEVIAQYGSGRCNNVTWLDPHPSLLRGACLLGGRARSNIATYACLPNNKRCAISVLYFEKYSPEHYIDAKDMYEILAPFIWKNEERLIRDAYTDRHPFDMIASKI